MPGCKCKSNKRDGSLWVEFPPAKMPDAFAAAMHLGGVFDSAFAYPFGQTSQWAVAYVFRLENEGLLAVAWAHGNSFHSVCEKLPAVVWDERKMHEITGAEFHGLSDTRPIVSHPENAHLLGKQNKTGGRFSGQKGKAAPYVFLGTGTEGEFQVPVGPVHAGIIEPGHFRFHVSGEGINKLEIRLSFMHRGIEGAAKGRKMQDAFGIVEQVSGDESVANSVAFAQAAESLSGIKVPPAAESLRPPTRGRCTLRPPAAERCIV